MAGASARGVDGGAAGPYDGGHSRRARGRLREPARHEADCRRSRTKGFLVGRRVPGPGRRSHGGEGARSGAGPLGPDCRASRVHGGAIAPQGCDACAGAGSQRQAGAGAGTDRCREGSPIRQLRASAGLGRKETLGRAGSASRDRIGGWNYLRGRTARVTNPSPEGRIH